MSITHLLLYLLYNHQGHLMLTKAQKQLLKAHRITENQVELIRLVAQHPIFGAHAPSMSRILPGALRRSVVEEVWLDRGHPATRLVKDYHIGHIGNERLANTSNKWFEVSEEAVAFMQMFEPGWSYSRPSDKWLKAA